MQKVKLGNGTFDHSEITGRVRNANRSVESRMAKKLAPHKSAADRICISAVGSDGRLEKGDVSPLEVVFLHKDIELVMVTALGGIIGSMQDDNVTPATNISCESKSIGSDGISFVHGDGKRPYPSRIIDSYVLFGNPRLLELAKTKMLDEWHSASGKRMVKAIKERKRDARRIMLSGTQVWKGQEVTHFDLDNGNASYGNDGEVKIRSVKPGPLRFVQSTIELGIVMLGRDMARNGKRSAMIEILNRIPTPTVEKLEFLSDLNVVSLPASDIQKVCDSYLSFLRVYHASEESHIDGRNIVQFDPAEAKERIDLLVKLLEKPLIRS